MAAAYLPRSFVSAAGYGFPLRRGGLPSSFSLRVSNGDDSRSSEERARTTLKELDDQLSSGDAPPRPRPLPGIGTEIEKPAPVKRSVPVLSDGLLVYIAGGLLLLTIVNNVLFYFFFQRPNQTSEITQEKKSDSLKITIETSLIAPQPQARTEM